MITDSSIQIDAPPEVVWEVFTDVDRWPDWTASVSSLTALDGEEIAPGKRFEIVQPKFPKLVWTVTSVDPGRSWTWTVRSFGATTHATHELSPVAGDRTVVRQRIEQRGPIGTLVGMAVRRRTRQYLKLEAEGLKRTSEQRRRRDAATA
jgi:ligand-binding SRPBCC domain-containing protein